MNKLVMFAIAVVLASGLYAQPKRRVSYRPTMMAQKIDQTATDLGFATQRGSSVQLASTVLESADGKKLTVDSGYFASSAEAKRYLDWKISNAARLIRRGIRTDRRGRASGEWAEILVHAGSPQLAVLWISGATFRVAYGTSFADLREVERQYEGPRSYGRKDSWK